MTVKRVQELVALFVERRESGDRTPMEAFAEEHPEYKEELLRALKKVQETEQVLGDIGLPIDRLGPYRLIEQIGSGGMGRVFRATHEELTHAVVALKLLQPQVLTDERARRRFEREARVLSDFEHPGIVKVIDHDTLSGVPYLAMEWVRGPTLATLLEDAREEHAQQNHRTPSDALRLKEHSKGYTTAVSLVAGLARAVEAVHAAGVLHRDIKPGNVILRDGSSPVLVDFGLTRSDATLSLTGTGELLGTPRYMSPEQARGEETDERTDLFALGLILYELLTLKAPREGLEAMAVLRQAGSKPIPPVRRSAPRVPKALNQVVLRASAFRPEARYQTVTELAADLEAILTHESVRARRFSVSEHLINAWAVHPRTLAGTVLCLLVLACLPLLREGPPDFDVLIERASLAYAADDLAGLAANAQQILAYDPEHPVGLFLEGLATDDLKGSTSSSFVRSLVQGLAHARGKVWPQARASFEHARELDPDSPLPQVLLDRLQQQIDQQQRKSEADAPNTLEDWLLLAQVFNGKERYPEAETAALRTIELDGDNQAAWVELCKAQYYQGNPQEALSSAQQGPAGAATQYAHTLLLSKKAVASDHARRVLKGVLQANPTDVKALRTMGLSYDTACLIGEARPWYEQAVQVAPQSLKDLRNLAWLLGGGSRNTCPKCADWYGDHPEDMDIEKARDLNLRILELDRGRQGLVSASCQELVRLGFAEQAQAMIEQILEEDASLKDPRQLNRLQKELDRLGR